MFCSLYNIDSKYPEGGDSLKSGLVVWICIKISCVVFCTLHFYLDVFWRSLFGNANDYALLILTTL